MPESRPGFIHEEVYYVMISRDTEYVMPNKEGNEPPRAA